MLILGYEIIAIGAIYALFAVYLQRRLSNMDTMYATQDAIKAKSDELVAMTKQGAAKEQLDLKQKEVMAMVSQSMKSQLKPMLVVFPLFIIVYYYAIPFAFASAAASLTFTMFNFDYKTLFIVVTFVVGFFTSMTLMSLDKKRLKKAKEMAPQQ